MKKRDIMGKKAQVTLFIIVAIIVAASLLTFYFLKAGEKKVQQTTSASVNDYVQSCIESTAEIGLIGMGLQGGYIYPIPNRTISYELIDIPYWYDAGKDISPSLSVLEKEFSGFLNQTVILCNDWSSFPNLNITEGNVSSKTRIANDSLTIEIKWPVTITDKSGKTEKLETFSRKFNVRLGRIHGIAKAFIGEEVKNPQSPCLSCMIDLVNKNDMTGELRIYNNSLIFTIHDAKSKINDQIYEFKFAGKIK